MTQVEQPSVRAVDGPAPRATAASALAQARCEVLPFAGTAEAVQKHLPRDLVVTVTASPRRGIEPTIRLTERLARAGYAAVPHLAARLVANDAHLVSILHRLQAVAVDDVFVIGGDGPEPAGAFADAPAILRSMQRLGSNGDARIPGRVGIAGYPEGHPRIPDRELDRALREKAPLASYVVSQMCFDADVITGWVDRLRDADIELPVHAGVAGRVDPRTLLRVSSRIGVGDSAAFLRKHRHAMLRLVLPGAFGPDRLVLALAPGLADPARGLSGLHLYTLGDIAATEAWRRRSVERLRRGR